MQSQLNTQHINTDSHLQQNADLSCNGYYIAQLFVYYRRKQNPYIKKHLPIKLISAKSLYSKHKNKFDTFAISVNKNKFDIDSYIKFCIINNGIKESSIDLCIASTTMIEKFYQHLKNVCKYRKIYAWISKSIKNIALYCVENDYFSTKDFLRYLIESKQIGAYVVSGKISIYYFAALPKFKNAIAKLDYFSRNELHCLEKYFDIYHSDVNNAFLYVKNTMINAIDLTDKAIFKLRQKSKDVKF